MNDQRWIIVPNWFGKGDEGLQHYRDRDPKWIKNYRRLLSRDEYRELTGHRRGILHGLWLEYAMSDGRLRVDPKSIGSRLGLVVKMSDLETLNHAGFIHFSASKPLALSEQRASPEIEKEREIETEGASQVHKPSPHQEARPADNGTGRADLQHISALIAPFLEEKAS